MDSSFFNTMTLEFPIVQNPNPTTLDVGMKNSIKKKDTNVIKKRFTYIPLTFYLNFAKTETPPPIVWLMSLAQTVHEQHERRSAFFLKVNSYPIE